MRLRTSAFTAAFWPNVILAASLGTSALAQNGGYVRFASPSPDACAVACANDRMCTSWSFGTVSRSYGQSQSPAPVSAMCSFSGSSVVQSERGMISGLPRRDSRTVQTSQTASSQSQSNSRQSNVDTFQQQAPTQVVRQVSGGQTGWEVRPAPWLSPPPPYRQSAPTQSAPTQSAPTQSAPTQSAAPQSWAPQSLIPSQEAITARRSEGATARIEYDTPAAPVPAQGRPIVLVPPIQSLPVPAPIVGVRPSFGAPNSTVVRPTQQMIRAAPVVQTPLPLPAIVPTPRAPAAQTRQLAIPEPPPGTRDMPVQPQVTATIPLPAQVQSPRVPSVPPSAPTRSVPSSPRANLPPPARAAVPRPAVSPQASSRAATQRSTPAQSAAPAPQESNAAAPPRQEVATVASPSRTSPRQPVRDPSNPESFRGADGMIDAAEMRRAQLNAAREQGTPAYSVQREWEAIEAERQRAAAAGEVRVDPLAGTTPVPPPPETRAERRAREAAEAAEDAAEQRAASGEDEDIAREAAPQRPATSRRTRAAPRQTSANQASTPTRQAARRAPPQALDREPRLSGGPN